MRKQVKVKKEFGVWFYEKVMGDDLDAPIYELYDSNGKMILVFGSYGDMKDYIVYGIIPQC